MNRHNDKTLCCYAITQKYSGGCKRTFGPIPLKEARKKLGKRGFERSTETRDGDYLEVWTTKDPSTFHLGKKMMIEKQRLLAIIIKLENPKEFHVS